MGVVAYVLLQSVTLADDEIEGGFGSGVVAHHQGVDAGARGYLHLMQVGGRAEIVVVEVPEEFGGGIGVDGLAGELGALA